MSLPASRGCPIAPVHPAKPPPRPSPPSAAKEHQDEVRKELETQHNVSVYWTSTDMKGLQEGAFLHTPYSHCLLTLWSTFCI